MLALFGDKARALALAVDLGVPVLEGTRADTGLDEARNFLAGGPVMVKGVGGGGGRGMQVVRSAGELAQAWERCRSEARQSFGRAELYVERLLEGARHVEVRIVDDTTGAVTHLWDRDCSAQRRHQKLSSLATLGRPPTRPRSRAAARPSFVPMTMGSRMNSARAAKTWKTSRPPLLRGCRPAQQGRQPQRARCFYLFFPLIRKKATTAAPRSNMTMVAGQLSVVAAACGDTFPPA
ncbi:hypothetical protein ACFYP4_16900 [Streptomyces sp. NPDC005551]|uniref:ATP-binding protein n=1 Tax=Streptomyces sp. NPDC005551 TaxID=3364725 RepID=UPI0036CF6DAD